MHVDRLPLMEDASCAFVILSWNSARYIERCLDAIVSLPFKSCDIRLLDNGSTDGTAELVRERYAELMSDDGRCRLHLTAIDENHGTTATRNQLLAAVDPSTDYICVLDSDTQVNAEAFAAMCAHYAADEHTIGVMGPRMKDDAGVYHLSGRMLPTLGIKLGKACPIGSVSDRAGRAELCPTPVVDGLQEVGYLISACWLMPYSSYTTVGPLDEKIFFAPEDADWCARARLAGLRVVLATDAEIIHSYQRQSKKAFFSKTNALHIAGLARYFRKCGYLFDARKVWDPRSDGRS